MINLSLLECQKIFNKNKISKFFDDLCSVCCDHYLLIVQQVTNTAHLSSTLPSDQLIKKARSHCTTLLRKQVESREAFPNFNAKGANPNNTKMVKKR
jgi:hypothetical protein